LRVPSAANAYTQNLTLGDYHEYANGYIFVCPFTALQSPDTSDISINVYAWSDDIHYNGFTSTNLPVRRKILLESDDSCVESVEVSCLELNPSSASNSHISEDHYGEEPMSFRALLHRYVSVFKIPSAVLAAADNFLGFYVDNTIYPANNNKYASSVDATLYDLYSYLRYAYLGIRGGVRVRPRIWTTRMSATNTYSAKVSLLPPSDADAAPSLLNNVSFDNSFNEGTLQHVVFTQGGVEAELPFYSNNLFLFSFSSSLAMGTSIGVMDPVYFRNYRYQMDTWTGNATILTTYDLDFAIGEDFNLLRFSGAPYYSTV